MTLCVSVVIPTHRRMMLLSRCLTALTEQSLPYESFQVIVVSDGRDTDTERLVAGVAARSGMAVHCLSLDRRRGPAAARNRGWRAALAPIVAFTDDDTIPDSDWLACGLVAFSDDTDAVWGRTVVPLPSEPTDYENDAARLAHAGFVTANCFCRRSALVRVGGFDERFTRAWREDSDLYFSLIAGQSRVVHAPRALMLHPLRPAPWGVSVPLQRKAAFNALLYKKHRALYRAHIQSAPPWRYYAIVAALLVVWAGALFMPQAAVAAGSAWIVLTADFCRRRLAPTSRAASHVAEMIVTSALIPPIAVFWRLYGAARYRVLFL